MSPINLGRLVPTMSARREELRALGPTPEDFDGPGSPRPADLAECWEIIEQLDLDALAEGSCFAAHTQLLYRLDALVTRWTKGAYGPNWEDYPIVQQAVEELKAAIRG